MPQSDNAATDDRCFINNGGFALDGKTHLTGAQIRAMPTPSIRDTDDLWMEVPDSEDVLVRYDEVVPVAGRHFFSVPQTINAGSPDAATRQEVRAKNPPNVTFSASGSTPRRWFYRDLFRLTLFGREWLLELRWHNV